MLFAAMGFFRAMADTEPANLQEAFNEHLGQGLLRIRLAGPLRDRDGRRVGMMACIEAATFADAERYLHQSPYFKAGLYDRVQVVQFDLEVGAGELK